MLEAACPTVHPIECSEIWGGNHGDALDAETGAVRASLFSRACDGCQGGDIYYFSVCSSGELTRVAIVDVMGHGAAVSDTSQWLYESLVRHMNSPDNAAVLTDLNKASVDKGYKAMSTAAVAAFYRSNRSLCFSYAGHHEFLLNRKGASDWVPIRGREAKAFGDIPLGVDARALFTQKNIALSSGDRVLLYTDGIVEAPNNNDEPFGLQRLVQTLQATSSDQLEYVRASVLDALLEHTADSLVHDDVTFMVLEVTGETNRGLAN